MAQAWSLAGRQGLPARLLATQAGSAGATWQGSCVQLPAAWRAPRWACISSAMLSAMLSLMAPMAMTCACARPYQAGSPCTREHRSALRTSAHLHGLLDLYACAAGLACQQRLPGGAGVAHPAASRACSCRPQLQGTPAVPDLCSQPQTVERRQLRLRQASPSPGWATCCHSTGPSACECPCAALHKRHCR